MLFPKESLSELSLSLSADSSACKSLPLFAHTHTHTPWSTLPSTMCANNVAWTLHFANPLHAKLYTVRAYSSPMVNHHLHEQTSNFKLFPLFTLFSTRWATSLRQIEISSWRIGHCPLARGPVRSNLVQRCACHFCVSCICSPFSYTWANSNRHREHRDTCKFPSYQSRQESESPSSRTTA